MALYAFLETHRDQILERTRQNIVAVTPKGTREEIIDSLPELLDDVVRALRAQNGLARETAETGTDGEKAAIKHGRQRLRLGFTIKELVHDYGAVCNAVISLAEQNGAIAPQEYKVMNGVLDAAIAESVTEYSGARAKEHERAANLKATEHLGVVAHELRNAISSAILAFDAIQNGRVATRGRTSDILGRSLERLKWLIDRSLTEVRLRSRPDLTPERTSLRALLEDVEASASVEAEGRSSRVVVDVDRDAEIVVDRQLIISAVANMAQNAIKYSRNGAEIVLRGMRTADGGITVEVEDECGGLPEGKVDDLFRPFVRGAEAEGDGLGLGLAIARRAVEAHGGAIHVRNRPRHGCTFCIQLPVLA